MGKHFFIPVDEIPGEGLHLTTSWDSAALEGILESKDEPFAVISPVELDIHAARSAQTIIAEGSFHLALQLHCVRCLTAFTHELAGSFRYVLSPATDSLQQRGRAGEDDNERTQYTDDRIDLRPLVREQIYLAIPDYPHCSEHCKGLCPRCGANLNETTCACPVQPAGGAASPFRIVRKKNRRQG